MKQLTLRWCGLALLMASAVGAQTGVVADVRAALRNGLSAGEIREVLLQTAVYCGVPAANAAFRVAQQVIAEAGPL